MSTISKTAGKPLAVGIAAAIALGGTFALGATSPSAAAPLSVNPSALKEAAPGNVVDARWRYRRHRSGHAIAGLALGIIGSAIAAHQYRRYHRYHYYPHYYRPYGYYGRPSCIRRYGTVYCR